MTAVNELAMFFFSSQVIIMLPFFFLEGLTSYAVNV
jgi:hypothetical protein